jgi:hypothetical protein
LRGPIFAASLLLVIAFPPAGASQAQDRSAGTVERPQRHDSQGTPFRLLQLGGRTVRWTMPGKGLPATVTYAFVSGPMQFPGARNCDAMTAPAAALQKSGVRLDAFRREVRAAFAEWERAANIVFRETASVADAGILIGGDAKPRGRAFTNVALRDETAPRDGKTVGTIRQSLICLNPQKPWKIGFDGNLHSYDVRYTIMHEIGHAIGLDHPSPEGQLMSFRYVETKRGLQPGDVAGAVALYGKRGAGGTSADAHPVLKLGQGRAPVVSGDRVFGLGDRD